MENNLAETAFFVERFDGDYELRWFTPAVEVPLCGHATLAAAWVLFNRLGLEGDKVAFHSRGGRLSVTRDGEMLMLDHQRQRRRRGPASGRDNGRERARRVGRAESDHIRRQQ